MVVIRLFYQTVVIQGA
jgi:Tfp pilus assembly protein PilN